MEVSNACGLPYFVSLNKTEPNDQGVLQGVLGRNRGYVCQAARVQDFEACWGSVLHGQGPLRQRGNNISRPSKSKIILTLPRGEDVFQVV